ncbi:UDP-glucose 4-epimerase [Succinivibrio dextrinosolvens DSM 3072]|uniref:UDP-glucose 4-epimerase n=1 Tax=Succinivibrio dextrinosolvens DSM 3072 TaxID=1123324 RepID=A0A1T4VBT3_9GAMM|nr:NAD(P)-dependent oxidoreductase [Succinivibrio dextrinosolvens]SKA62390.1 UDP-glucose 4-epimerase [Succinivibrio dextrinosolvens DSM 3072]
MKKIIIFGATGHIGVYLVDYLSRVLSYEYELIAVGRRYTEFCHNNSVKFICCDITKPEDFDKLPSKDIYAVINLSGVLPAYSSKIQTYKYVDTNITGSLRILDFSLKNSVNRVIFTHTWSDLAGYWGKENVLYPDMTRKLIYHGDHAFYAITRSMVVDTLEYYRQEFGLKYFLFRLPNVYLYHPDIFYYVNGEKKLVSYRYMIERVINGDDIEMWGNPLAYKDILYVKDLCQLIHKSLFANVSGGMYNAGTGIKTTLQEQLEGIIKIFSCDSKKSSIISKPEKSSFPSFVMDISKAKNDLGYSPKYLYLDYLSDYKKERELRRFDSVWNSKAIL